MLLFINRIRFQDFNCLFNELFNIGVILLSLLQYKILLLLFSFNDM